MAGLLSGRPKLRSGGYTSAERASLAIAIEAHETAVADAAKLRSAVADLEARHSAARSAEWAAEAAVERAVTDGPAYTTAMITGRPWDGEPVLPVREAQASLEAARDAAKVAREAPELLRPELARAAHSVEYAADRVKEAARAVLKLEAADAAAKIAQHVLRLRYELAQQEALVRWMAGNGCFPVSSSGEIAEDGVRHAVWGRPVDRIEPERVPACAPWQSALAALTNDANAEIPK